MMDEPRGEELLRQVALRVAALEDNVAFLEVWSEEHQDRLDRIDQAVYFYEGNGSAPPTVPPPVPGRLRVVDLREPPEPPAETDHDRRVRALRARIRRMRNGLPGDPGLRTERLAGRE
ncbi:MAG: hypothetical protein ACRDY7_02580 [Acidimicrobiia bacterium]